ncbi:MAG: glycosyltransferase 87 family protein [Acidimicrobiales bacterium]
MRDLPRAVAARISSWGPEAGDAVLYAAAALFAGLTMELTSQPPYRTWGELALGPYLAAAVLSALVGRYRARDHPPAFPSAVAGLDDGTVARRARGVRIGLFVFVLFGATLLPLSVEVALRSAGSPGAHAQPEVRVIEHAGQQVALGHNPYRTVVRDHRVVVATPGEPAYESFFPYLPLMIVFGLPSSTHHPIRLTDARIFFTAVTMLVVAIALAIGRGPGERKLRTAQVLAVLPTAALPLATGGDDMPIVAFLLLGMVLAQRRQPGWSGLVFGIVSAMKFTAWPLAGLALFAARDRHGRRAPVRMALGMMVVVGPVVAPFVARNAGAFLQNVVLFPLGLAGVSSPAASALPGHLLVSWFPALHRPLPIAVALVGGFALVRRLVRRPPATAAEVVSLAAWAMLVAILFAPATRIGYLLYPVNFFVWAHLLRGADADRPPAFGEEQQDGLVVPSHEEKPVLVG